MLRSTFCRDRQPHPQQTVCCSAPSAGGVYCMLQWNQQSVCHCICCCCCRAWKVRVCSLDVSGSALVWALWRRQQQQQETVVAVLVCSVAHRWAPSCCQHISGLEACCSIFQGDWHHHPRPQHWLLFCPCWHVAIITWHAGAMAGSSRECASP